MENSITQDRKSRSLHSRLENLPPTPPYSEDNASISSSEEDDVEVPLPPLSAHPSKVLDVDKKTPDAHVPRDPRLIRLTGVHPFNVESPLSALFDEGFLTSPDLFYVRNHGAVPEVRDEDIPDWEFSVEGLVERPTRITLRELLEDYEQITSPITLVCAGNRRKEQNVVKKTKGFSWGAAGVSTALFTGVAMSEVIKRARPRKRAKYVCMEGADKLPNGYYGTSVKLNWVMDPNKGIMLSHKMNGETLRPDHGKPLRAVIPGQIGGRSVKWLKRLIVTATPSDNWYHIYDNRVLPTMVSPEESANNKTWWTDERYAIFDLSVNSAAAYPAHEEKVNITKGPNKYRVRGYAYSGGGRRVTRVEVSLDKGRTWRLSEIEYPEDKYRETNQVLFGGRIDMSWRENCFCWCLWSLDIPIADLADASDLVVRAMDDSMSVQPRDMYWSVLGMMNNPWYRLTITKEGDHLRFEHPTQPALMPGGWMEKIKKAGGNLTNGRWGEKTEGEAETTEGQEAAKEVCMIKEGLKKEITIDELRRHDDAANPWFVLNGEVYEGQTFMSEHPGGAQSIISAAGLDTSDEFMAIHSETAKSMMPKYHIGTLDAASRIALAEGPVEDASAEPSATFLRPRSWTKAVLSSKRQISADTVIFTFALQHPEQTLGLPTGQHLMIKLPDPVTGESIIRAYTPISETNQRGTMEVLIKLYLNNDSTSPPKISTSASSTTMTTTAAAAATTTTTTPATPAGRMSTAISLLPLGSPISFKGPIGKFIYLGRGHCTVNERPRHVRKFIMICGGSGITPIFQVFRAVMRDTQDPTLVTVLNGNRLLEDILCKAELDTLAKGNGHRAEVVYTLSKPPPSGWMGRRGRIDEELVKGKCRLRDFNIGTTTTTTTATTQAAGADFEAATPVLMTQNHKDTQSLQVNGDTATLAPTLSSLDATAIPAEDESGKMMALICGPAALEKAVHSYLRGMGWAEDDVLFF